MGRVRFLARVSAALEIALSDRDGKTLKTIPAPRKDDDPQQAKAAKKAFSAAKAELKRFTGQQTIRLYEAMCTQRTWPVADWRTYLLGHPLLKFLCQRLVWATCDGQRVTADVPPAGRRHTYGLRRRRGAACSRREYSCCPWLPASPRPWPKPGPGTWLTTTSRLSSAQFGRAAYVLPEEQRMATAIDDFEGHMVEAFKLRSAATKFGYTRGQAEDGGWFFDYLKAFPGLELEVRLEFSGNGLPEENRPVALVALAFRRMVPRQGPAMPLAASVPLGEVPRCC